MKMMMRMKYFQDQNGDKCKSTKLMKVKCIHCNENTYVKEDEMEEGFEMIEN